MRKLILVRHAKSSWSDPSLDDHDRPLNGRGRRAAPVTAEWLSRRGHLPDLVLCSSSVRTRETFARMAEAVPGLPEPVVEPALYHATPAELLARCADLPADASRVMLIGHQPGLGGFARRLAAAPVRPRCARAFEHFPTAAAAVLTLELDGWEEIAFGSAQFVDFARPRDLMEQ